MSEPVEHESSAIPVDHAFVCEDCDHRWYYDRRGCPECGSRATGTYELGVGTLAATTTVETTPPDVRSPNHLGIAAFDGGVRVLAQLAGDEPPAVGDEVTFAGEYRLRRGDESANPRLERVE